jgi:hypothetical protein
MSPKPRRTTNGPFPVLTVGHDGVRLRVDHRDRVVVEIRDPDGAVGAAAPCAGFEPDFSVATTAFVPGSRRVTVSSPLAVQTAPAETTIPLGLSCPVCSRSRRVRGRVDSVHVLARRRVRADPECVRGDREVAGLTTGLDRLDDAIGGRVDARDRAVEVVRRPRRAEGVRDVPDVDADADSPHDLERAPVDTFDRRGAVAVDPEAACAGGDPARLRAEAARYA